ncbi:oligopeptide/dipeptide ABC transporter ATP-binding protein [Paenarthrobacter histidinolovorans]|uniref:oligopeptide/dipeptide ABC transporter ATP-binding protein n=1 Tax=Paenarthrobacter histidinolovorans TaxID=43664 RepID=UPI00166DAE41|nr:ABC transporter ATP-binding protein [Paenarthrobacter histidinolovorans]GGJ40346.1 putative peptide ABC transporter ATP-binding protein y4tS [Paenarthrobacter histidinolovorans]
MIELRDISFRVGDKEILKSISMQVARGESVAIVGESGAGKTTLGRVLLGTQRQTSGEYLSQGQDIHSLPKADKLKWRRKCQAVFQNPTASLNPRLSIERSITEPLEVTTKFSKRARRAKAVELLAKVGLSPDLAGRLPHQLSGGQRQRVIIGRSISTDPEILLLDEPVSGLDVSARAQVLNVLSDLRRESNLTVVYITHDLATVGYLCDRVAVLYKGELVEILDVDQLHAEPDHPYTRALLSAVIAPDKTTTYTPTNERILEGSPACPFASFCPNAQERCLTDAPPLVQLDTGWYSRCHFAGQTKPAAELAASAAII